MEIRKSQSNVFESRFRNLFADSIILLFVCLRESREEGADCGPEDVSQSEKVFKFAMI